MAAADVAGFRLPGFAAPEKVAQGPQAAAQYNGRYFRYLPASTRRLYVLEPWLMPVGAMQIAASLIQRWWRLVILPGIWERLDAAEAEEYERAAAEGRWPNPVRVPERVLQEPDEYLLRPHRRNELPLYHVAALQIQRFCRARSPGMAAVRVQRWLRRLLRSRQQKQCYHEYRDMCKRFEMGTSPLELLKVINPREAELVDPASAITVMLRLGGYKFPPRIYYKLFLTGPVCDVGAFAPRTYAALQQEHFGGGLELTSAGVSQAETPALQQPGSVAAASLPSLSQNVAPGPVGTRTMLQVGSSSFQAVVGASRGPGDDTKGWYQRHEGNGWRPVAARTLQEAEMDPVARATAARAVPWHWSRLKRREDKEARQRLKRRKWMMRLYREGLAGKAQESAVDSSPGAVGGSPGAADSKEAEGRRDSVGSWSAAELRDLSDEELRAAAEKRVRERLGIAAEASVSLDGFLDAVLQEEEGEQQKQLQEEEEEGVDGLARRAPMASEAEELLAAGCPVDFDAPDWDAQAESLLRWAADLDSDLYQAEWASMAVSSTT